MAIESHTSKKDRCYYGYVQLARWDRPIGFWLLLWPTLIALWIAANGPPEPDRLLIFMLGVFLMRSVGCVINDIFDRDIDIHVARTKQRPLPQEKISLKGSIFFLLILLSLAALLLFLLTTLAKYIAVLALITAIIYPKMKRITHLAQFWLGMCFSWSIIMTFADTQNKISQIAWLLFFANLVWVVVYDTLYALVDRPYDKKMDLKSTAIMFEGDEALLIGMLQLVCLVAFIFVGVRAELSYGYYTGLMVASGLWVYQQILMHTKDEKAYFRAFLNNNWVGVALFSGLIFDYVLIQAL